MRTGGCGTCSTWPASPAGNAPGGDRVTFRVFRIPNEDRGRQWNEAELIELALHIGPGDEAEPVVTIMLPRED